MQNKVTRVKRSVDTAASNNIAGGFDVICVGIDAANGKHGRFILRPAGEAPSDVFTIPNSLKGFNCLLQKILACTIEQDEIKTGLEAGGHYNYSILGFLPESGLPAYALNPLHTKLYRKSLSLGKTKAGRADA